MRDKEGAMGEDGFPKMNFVSLDGRENPFPSYIDGAEVKEVIYDCCTPVTPANLADTLVAFLGIILLVETLTPCRCFIICGTGRLWKMG